MSEDAKKPDRTYTRRRERIRLAIPVRVSGRERDNKEWIEMTRLIEVTPFGARLTLKRPTEVGRLIHLALAMPRQLRVFDHLEPQYRIWALVRNVRLVDRQQEQDPLLEAGLAFVGKHPPRSYLNDPTQRYDIEQSTTENAVGIVQLSATHQALEVTHTDKRKESRQLIPIDVLIEVFQDDKLILSENTVTENISHRGATVFTTLDVSQGDFLKVSSERYNARVLASVRHRRTGDDGITRLHLEFVGGDWPL